MEESLIRAEIHSDDVDRRDSMGLAYLVQSEDATDAPTISWCRIICVNAHAFNYGLFYASVGVILLPEEALHLFPGSHAIALAVMLVLGGLSQLVQSCAERKSQVCLFLTLGGMYLARTHFYRYTYLGLLLVAMLALNVAYTGFAGLVSDIVPDHQMGVTSGIMGGMTASGAVTGLLLLGFVFEDLEHAYGVYAIAVLATTPFTWAAAREIPLKPEHQRPYKKDEIMRSYTISPKSHGDFFWVFCSRTGYYMAVSTQIYILYYLRDVMTDPNIANNAKTYTAILCVISQSCSGLVSLVAGGLTRFFGYKAMIYVACTVMAMVYLGYTVVHQYSWVVFLGVCYGSSIIFHESSNEFFIFRGTDYNGAYLAADYALAVECLPDKADGAKDLALWGIAAFLGTMFGPCLTGPTLSILGSQEGSDKYLFQGYVGVMCFGVLYSFLAAAFLVKVRSEHHLHKDGKIVESENDSSQVV